MLDVKERIGQGSYGIIYRAYRNDKEVAVKRIHIPDEVVAFDRAQIQAEMDIHREARHPHILPCWSTHGNPARDKDVYMVLDYAADGDLYALLHDHGRLEPALAATYIDQLARALQHLHDNQVIHRDVKPENVLLVDGGVKLCDFGWATKVPADGRFCGTLDYLSPEMIRHIPYDHRVDVWALGVVMFELLDGLPPFYAKDPNDTARAIVRGEVLRHSRHVDEKAEALLMQVLVVNPGDRLELHKWSTRPWMLDHLRRLGLQ